MYRAGVNWNFEELKNSRPAPNKKREEFLEWIQGFLDGVGDNPIIDDDQRENISHAIEYTFCFDYLTWWREWQRTGIL